MSAVVQTPITILLKLYSEDGTPFINEIDSIPLELQIKTMQPQLLVDTQKRRETVNAFNNADLKQHAYKRLRLINIFSKFYQDYYLLNEQNFKPVSHWIHRDFSINATIFFLVKSSTEKITDQKSLNKIKIIWKFVDYLCQFFAAKDYTGLSFVQEYGGGAATNKNNNNSNSNSNNNSSKANKTGFGLQIVKAVCKQFSQKTGQYTKVKKFLSEWAKDVMTRNESEQRYTLPSEDQLKKNLPYADKNLPANTKLINPSATSANAQSNEQWFWFCDEGNIEWVPYNDEHQKAINSAWTNGKNFAMVGNWKIDFDRAADSKNPVGRQYNPSIHNAWRRDVIRATPDKDGWINGVPYAKKPKY